MGKLIKLLFGIFLLAYLLIAIAARVPAEWVADAAVQAVPGLSLGGVSGTAWEGSASAAILQLPGQKLIDLGGLSWDVDVPALLAMNLCADVESRMARGHLCRSISKRNTLKQVIVDDIPVSMFGDMIGAQLGGVGSVAIRNAVITDSGEVKELDGNVTWMRARGNGGGGWFPLGSFAAELSDNGNGGVIADVVDVDGEFEIKLRGEIGLNSPPRLNGTIKPRPAAPQALVDTLMVFTEVLDDGTYKVTWPLGG